MKIYSSFSAPLFGVLITASLIMSGLQSASAQSFTSGDILVSSAFYVGTSNTINIGEPFPSVNANGTTNNAIANGIYPEVFNNDNSDANFGITAPITISELTPSGADVMDIAVPTNDLVTSFSSKSELALNLSPDGTTVSFAGYDAPVNAIDRSNAGTPGATNSGTSGPVDTATPTYRAIDTLNANGTFSSPTYINSYTGDNIRAAILTTNGYYTVGSTGLKTNTNGTGVQLVVPQGGPSTNAISPGAYNANDNSAKDNNFRGETIFNNSLYITKGSGSKGIDTVYQVGTSGTLPTGTNNTLSILPGFNTTGGASGPHPFGIWFANATTLYVADEGTGLYSDLATDSNGQNYAGLEKWSLIGGSWVMDYNLTNGLNIGQAYDVSGTSGGVSGTYQTITDGLRNITGKVNTNGTVTIYAITSTVDKYPGVATNGIVTAFDEGCDPNQLDAVTDTLADTNASQISGEEFTNLETAQYGQVLRGVSFTPEAVPESSSWALVVLGSLGGLIIIRARQRKN